LKKLKNIFGINSILMEGGPILNVALLRENLFDD
jgi:riboflavin biosynthesis pyrimidine reductase